MNARKTGEPKDTANLKKPSVWAKGVRSAASMSLVWLLAEAMRSQCLFQLADVAFPTPETGDPLEICNDGKLDDARAIERYRQQRSGFAVVLAIGANENLHKSNHVTGVGEAIAVRPNLAD